MMIYLGLDVSKEHIDVVSNHTPHFTITNDQQGFFALLDYFHEHQLDLMQIHACCEATNIYHLNIATFLYQHQIKISVVNPIAIKAYAKMQLKRIKTDKQDAQLIAQYCQKEQPHLWQPETPHRRQLKNIHRHRTINHNVYSGAKPFTCC